MLLGFGSDRWWRVQVIIMFLATVVIVALGAYQHLHAPLEVEFSILDAVILHAPEATDELCIELAFSNVGTQQIAVSDVSLCLVRHDPPRCHLIPGRLSPQAVVDRGLILPAGKQGQRMFQSSLGHDGVSEGLGIDRSGRFIVEASLLVTVADRRAFERRITVGELSAIVEDGAFCKLSDGDVIVRYVGG